MDWRTKWQNAHDQAAFYRSEQNTKEYWDRVSKAGNAGLAGEEHIRLLKEHLIREGLIDRNSSVLDVGCGDGAYAAAFAEVCGQVMAADYSEGMLDACRRRCERAGLSNVYFLLGDILQDEDPKHYDCVLACLNPATYQPEVFDRLMAITDVVLIYFSMDTGLEKADREPVYCGCNSVQYAEQYLKEQGIVYQKILYRYTYQAEGGKSIEIPFAYLVVRKIRLTGEG